MRMVDEGGALGLRRSSKEAFRTIRSAKMQQEDQQDAGPRSGRLGYFCRRSGRCRRAHSLLERLLEVVIRALPTGLTNLNTDMAAYKPAEPNL